MEWEIIMEYVTFNFKIKMMLCNTLPSNTKVNMSQNQITIGKARLPLE